MSGVRRWAVFGTSLGVAFAVACSSFGDGAQGDATTLDSTQAPDDAGPPRIEASAPTTDASADADSGPPVRFCATFNATVPLCDDFEENDGGISTAWTLVANGGTVTTAVDALRPGHVAKVVASGTSPQVALSFQFDPDLSKSNVTLDFDMRIDTAGYNYLELAAIHTADYDAAAFYGIAKLGGAIGMDFTPYKSMEVNVDAAWHHVSIALRHSVSGYSQTVSIDDTLIQRTNDDLSPFHGVFLQLGVLAAVVDLGQPLAVVYLDDVLVQVPP
jgi:hypothetical protein